MPFHNCRRTAPAGSRLAFVAATAFVVAITSSCRPTDAGSVDPTVTLLPPGGSTRTVDFETDEGTGMSIDVSPDGTWIAFDLLGHVYRIPIEGGRAVSLTQNSGPALNFHPAISPDGKRIAFVSDRNGQLNIWTMAADGSDPRVVVADPDTRFLQPAWSPDGTSIVAVRLFRTPGRSWHRQNRTLYRMPAEGGAAEPIIEERLTQPDSPAFSADGKYLYYHVSYSIAEGLGMLTAGHRILRREVATGALENVRLAGSAELTPEFRAALKSGGYATDVGDEPAVTTPKSSPDGKWLAFSREMPDQTFEWRGHRMRPATALWVRNLETGEERVALGTATKDLTQINTQYAYRPFPGYAWMPDGKSIVLTVDGKIQRLDVESGALTPIPFTARVLRTLAEPVRSKLTFRDDSLEVRFIQWPASSADGRRLAFVAAGRIWLMDLPDGLPRPLLDRASDGVELTPVWSPDGKAVAFTTWSEAGRGHLWTLEPGQAPRRISTEPGEYLGPVWSADGRWIAVSRGPGPGAGGWNPWDHAVGWKLVRFPVAGGPARDLAPIGAWGIAALGRGGRLSFPAQDRPDGGSPLLFKPFPDSSALANVVRIRTIGWDGESPASHLEFPARLGRGNTPVWSPDGDWAAFDAAHEIFVSPTRPDGPEVRIEVDPNVAVADRKLVGTWGGIYPRWRNATTLEFASGNRYLAYEPGTGRLTTTEVKLVVPKPEPEGSIALVGAKIVTVDSQGVIDRGTVVVTGSRISCVGTCDTTGVSRVLDLTGKTIIPGLVDLHAHHTDEPSGVVPTHRRRPRWRWRTGSPRWSTRPRRRRRPSRWRTRSKRAPSSARGR